MLQKREVAIGIFPKALIIFLVVASIAFFLFKFPSPTGYFTAETSPNGEIVLRAAENTPTKVNLLHFFETGTFLVSADDPALTGNVSVVNNVLEIGTLPIGEYRFSTIHSADGQFTTLPFLLKVGKFSDFEIAATNTDTKIEKKLADNVEVKLEEDILIRFNPDKKRKGVKKVFKSLDKKQKLLNSGLKLKSILKERKFRAQEIQQNLKMKSLENIPYARIRVSKNILKKLLEEHPDIVEIVIDQKLKTELTESIPLINADQVHQTVLQETNIKGRNISICVLDTGVDSTHQDLANSIVDEACFCSVSDLGQGGCCPNQQAEDSLATDDQGHGTHVAGIIAAHDSLTGVAPESKLVIVKVCDNNGDCKASDLLAGLDYCIQKQQEHNVKVATASIGDNQLHETCPTYMDTAIEDVTTAGITPVFAAGNQGGQGINYPACSPNAIAVGASTKQDSLASFSNRGPRLDILAPGKDILSLAIGGGTTTKSGTSMAAPHISGVLALLYQQAALENKPLDTEIARSLLRSAGKMVESYPRVNALSASNMLLSDYIIDKQERKVENLQKAKIVFSSNADLDKITQCVNLKHNYAEVFETPECQAALDVPSTISFFNLGMKTPLILKNGQKCGPTDCFNKQYIDGTLTFDVSGFTYYQALENETFKGQAAETILGDINLSIIETSDIEIVFMNETITFYINLSNKTSGVQKESAECNVSFINETGEYKSLNLSFNKLATQLHANSTNLTISKVFEFNATCRFNLTEISLVDRFITYRNITKCSDDLSNTHSEQAILTKKIEFDSTSLSPCLEINYPNQTLDCKNNAITNTGDGSYTQEIALVAKFAKNTTIQNCYINNSGIIMKAAPNSLIKNTTIVINSFGISADNVNGTRFFNNTMEDSKFSELRPKRVKFNGSKNLLIVDNNFSKQILRAALNLSSCQNSTVKYNIFDNGYGIDLEDSSNISITKNTFHEVKAEGILMKRSSFSIITNNYFGDPSFEGIEIRKGTENKIMNNIITDSYRGIFIDDSNEIIQNNTINGSTAYGIHLLNSTNVLVRYNNISDSGDHGIFIEGEDSHSANITLEENFVDKNTKYGVYILNTENITIIRDRYRDNDYDGLVLINVSDSLIENLTTRINSRFGVIANNIEKVTFHYGNYTQNDIGLIIASSTNNRVLNLSSNDNINAIHLVTANFTTIESSNIGSNSKNGIIIDRRSFRNNITYCTGGNLPGDDAIIDFFSAFSRITSNAFSTVLIDFFSTNNEVKNSGVVTQDPFATGNNVT